MKTFFICLAIVFGLAGAAIITDKFMIDMVEHIVCTKDKTVITCNYIK